jgi:hypothetical protein
VQKIKDTVQKTGPIAQYSLKSMEKSDNNLLNREQDTPQSFYWKKLTDKRKGVIYYYLVTIL